MNLGLRAPIPRPGSIHARVAAARLLAEGAESRVEAARRRLRVDIMRHYAQLAYYTADLEELDRAPPSPTTPPTAEGPRRPGGRHPRRPLARRGRSRRAPRRARRVHGELARTEAALTLLVAPGTSQKFLVDRDDLEPGDLPRPQDPHRAGRVARQELRETQTATNEAEAAVYLARRTRRGRGSRGPRSTTSSAPSPDRLNNPTTPAFGFGLALDIPLFSLNLRKIKAARAVVRQRELEERAASRSSPPRSPRRSPASSRPTPASARSRRTCSRRSRRPRDTQRRPSPPAASTRSRPSRSPIDRSPLVAPPRGPVRPPRRDARARGGPRRRPVIHPRVHRP
jgi:hypothetical protein